MVINRAYLKRLANSFNNVAIHIIEADASRIAWKDDSKWFAAVNFDHFNSISVVDFKTFHILHIHGNKCSVAVQFVRKFRNVLTDCRNISADLEEIAEGKAGPVHID